MLTLHHLNDSRSQRVLWLLEELGRDYRIQHHQRDPQTMLAPASLKAVHPLGKAPVIEDEGRVIAETGAILEHLAAGTPWRPDPATDTGRAVTYWLHYAEGSAMPPLLMRMVFDMLPKRSPWLLSPLVRAISKGVLDSYIDPDVARQIDWWEASLSAPFFAGEAPSVADVAMSFPIEMLAANGALTDRPRLTDWLARIHARPAYRRALEKGGPYRGAA